MAKRGEDDAGPGLGETLPDIPVAAALEGHRSVLRGYFRQRVRDREDAEDYVQDVYLRVLAARPDPRKIRSWRGFLLRAASNLLVDKHRRDEVRMAGQHVPIEAEMADAAAIDPERRLIARDELGVLGEALSALSPVARDVFLLVRVEGLSHREAGERLGIGTKAASSHVERALARLGAALARHES